METSRNVSCSTSVRGQSAEVVQQVTSCREIYVIGSLHLIHGRTTILPVDRGTPGRRDGLFKATLSQNGRRRDRVPYCGFMANVRSPLTFNALTETDVPSHS